MGRYFLTGLFFIVTIAHGQGRFTPAVWENIDTAVRKKIQLRTLSIHLDSICATAWSDKNYAAYLRGLHYKIKVQDLRTEDSVYFSNSMTIDSLLQLRDLAPELEAGLRIMLAKRLSGFSNKYLRFNRARYEREGIPVNWAQFTNPQLAVQAGKELERARRLVLPLNQLPVEDYMWLSTDPFFFLFKPVLSDLVIAEQLWLENKSSYQYTGENNLFYKDRLMLMNVSPAAFINRIEYYYQLDTARFRQLHIYKEWIELHKGNEETAAMLESMARKSVFESLLKIKEDSIVQYNYEKYLEQNTNSPFKMVRAYAVFQWSLILNESAGLYSPVKDEYAYYTGTGNGAYNTSMRFKARQAIELYLAHRMDFDSFAFLGNIMNRMVTLIKEPALRMKIKDAVLPGSPLLAELFFRNTDTLYFRIVRENFTRRPINTKLSLIQNKLQMPVTRDSFLVLPAMNDYNKHVTALKFDALAPGKYTLLFSGKPLVTDTSLIHSVQFTVSRIALIENGDRVYALDRKTGRPLKNLLVLLLKQVKAGKLRVPSDTLRYTTGNSGHLVLRNTDDMDVLACAKEDTIGLFSVAATEKELPDNIYSKEEYDDKTEFFEENAKAYIYTDRSIYRPGQKVFFKALFLTRHPETGETMLMSPQNLGQSLFNHTFKKWLRDSEPVLEVLDPSGNKIDSFKIIPDKWGAVSGSFIIPKSAATGEWSIEPDYIDKDWNVGEFRVEEYKKPSYEIVVTKPVTAIRPGDPVVFNVKLKSFAGAPLSHVQVDYTLSRRGTIPGLNQNDNGSTDFILDSTVYADENGELVIKYTDSLLKRNKELFEEKWTATYSLDLTAKDQSGEIYEADEQLRVSSRPVSFKLNGENKLDRSDTVSLKFSATDLNAGLVEQEARLIVRKNEKPGNDKEKMIWPADCSVFSLQELEQWFPGTRFTDEKEKSVVLLDTMILTDDRNRIVLESSKFPAGLYEAELSSSENGYQTGKSVVSFELYDSKDGRAPVAGTWFYLPQNTALPGREVRWYTQFTDTANYAIQTMSYFTEKPKKGIQKVYTEKLLEPGLSASSFRMPADAVNEVLISTISVFNNQLFSKSERVFLNNSLITSPEILVERYRSRLVPGAEEQFKVSVRTNNRNTLAELMTVMYDASLDKLEEHPWRLPSIDRTENPENKWNNSIGDMVNSWISESALRIRIEENLLPALWWINPVEYDYIMGDWSLAGNRRMNDKVYDFSPNDMDDIPASYRGNLYGSIISSKGLDEVVVTSAFGMKRVLAGSVSGVSVIRLRGMTSLSAYSQPLIIMDGVVYEGGLDKIDPNLITDLVVLKDASATAIYGARAAKGVLVLSTKGPVILPEPQTAALPPRKNFNETAFFFPAIHAGKDGYYTISFTMPESVTAWNWKLLAHTRDARFAYLEKKLQTQLPLMIQASKPRVFYQGDRLVLNHRVSNLDTMTAKGTVTATLEDVVTGENLDRLLAFSDGNTFSLSAGTTGYISTQIRIPDTMLNPVKLVIRARSAGFSDAEEHIIPVLSKSVFVRQAKSFVLTGKDTLIKAPALPADARFFGTGLTVTPRPDAALVNSLPYMADYPWDCAEQLCNKIRALYTGIQLMRNEPLFQSAKQKMNQVAEMARNKKELPAEFPAISTPWLSLADQQQQDQLALFRLLDTVRATGLIHANLEKLKGLIKPDKGISWFPGGVSDPQISLYVLDALVDFKRAGLFELRDMYSVHQEQWITDLAAYCDQHYLKEISNRSVSGLLNFYYTRSGMLKDLPLSAAAEAQLDSLLVVCWKMPEKLSFSDQARLITTTIRCRKQTDWNTNAVSLARSLREEAVEDPVYGTRWKSFSDKEDQSMSDEETMLLMATALETAGQELSVKKGILKWLFTAREGHHWSSTRSTAAVIQWLRELNMKEYKSSAGLIAKSGTDTLHVTNDLLNGKLADFSGGKIIPSPVRIGTEGNGPVSGSLIWYYFSDTPVNVNPAYTLQLKKTLFRLNEQSGAWQVVESGSLLKMGEKIRVELQLETGKELRYVMLYDKRASGLEPEETQSGQLYSPLSHYVSVRDDGRRCFIPMIPAGRYVFSYELRVAFAGDYINGPAGLQCMYRPEVSVYSNGQKLSATE